jgi:aryl-alcohol dehydrogenase-like predicted oxidoreductase
VDVRELGASGLVVSSVGLGCNSFGARIDREQSVAVVRAALEAGVRLFDTADGYGDGASELYLGEGLAGHRDDVVVATKFGSRRAGEKYGVPRGSPLHVRRATEDSLVRLGTDRIDLLYYHMHDGVTPIAETLGALNELVIEGKVRAIACANFDADRIREADAVAVAARGARFCAMQNEYSLLAPEAQRTIQPVCAELGLGFVPYWPLAYGLLTGKYRPGEPPPARSRLGSGDPTVPPIPDGYWERLGTLIAFASACGRTLLELAIGALVSRPAVTSVIAGVSSPEQVWANVAASDHRLSDEELADLDRLIFAA